MGIQYGDPTHQTRMMLGLMLLAMDQVRYIHKAYSVHSHRAHNILQDSSTFAQPSNPREPLFSEVYADPASRIRVRSAAEHLSAALASGKLAESSEGRVREPSCHNPDPNLDPTADKCTPDPDKSRNTDSKLCTDPDPRWRSAIPRPTHEMPTADQGFRGARKGPYPKL